MSAERNNFSSRGAMLVLLALALVAPQVAYASDTTGAVPFFFGIILVALLFIGVVLAVVLRFVFKTGNWAWLMVIAVPAGAMAVGIFYFTLRQGLHHGMQVHAGPEVGYHGSHSVTVSKKFGRAELEKALAKMQSAEFRKELSEYTSEPASNFVYAMDLTIQANANARRYVTISTEPEVNVNTPSYEGIMFLLSKAVIESDPAPADELYSEPKKILSAKN